MDEFFEIAMYLLITVYLGMLMYFIVRIIGMILNG